MREYKNSMLVDDLKDAMIISRARTKLTELIISILNESYINCKVVIDHETVYFHSPKQSSLHYIAEVSDKYIPVKIVMTRDNKSRKGGENVECHEAQENGHLEN